MHHVIIYQGYFKAMQKFNLLSYDLGVKGERRHV